jgi:hypothetical protein
MARSERRWYLRAHHRFHLLRAQGGKKGIDEPVAPHGYIHHLPDLHRPVQLPAELLANAR